MMDLLTINEAAKLVQISSAAFRLWIKRGVLPVVRVPRSNYIRVRRHDLEELLTPAKSPPTEEPKIDAVA